MNLSEIFAFCYSLYNNLNYHCIINPENIKLN